MNGFNVDIFCQVIDNFGDAGVCIRLARQLHSRGHRVRIYTDKPELFSKIYNQNNFPVYSWEQANCAPEFGLVIEAFACELPDEYKKTIKSQSCVWINLEYLSAENWVDEFHQLPSPQSDGSNKYFFFPGFSKHTGGLLRDDAELNLKNNLRHKRIQSIKRICQTEIADIDTAKNPLIIFLFCYPEAPLAGLQAALQASNRNIFVLLAGGPRNIFSSDRIQIIDLPFLNQTDFDSLLWLSDINFIRGEDSLVQASWCGTPMVWQAYTQADNTHMTKLAAWLKIYTPYKQIQEFITAWNNQDNHSVAELFPELIQSPVWDKWQNSSQAYTQTLQHQTDLVSNLEQFYKQKSALITD